MTLPLVPAVAGRRAGRRIAGAALAVVLLLPVGRMAAAADDDPYSATVKVDASSDTVAKARDMARTDGQRRALTAVVERLAGGSPVKLPRLDDNAIANLVTSFEVENERMSTVRYIADYTFHFRAADIQRVLRGAGVTPGDSAAAAAAKPIVLLPVYQSGAAAVLWDDPNPWRAAWARRPVGSGAVRLAVPLGDIGDVAAIDGDKARLGDGSALAAVARQNGADEAIVALAVARGGDRPVSLDVTVRRYRQGQLVDTHAAPLDANPGESQGDFLQRSVTAIAANIETGWKKEASLPVGQRASLTAALPINSLDDWLRLRQRLAGVSVIRKIDLLSLSRQEAVIEIQHAGDMDQLKAALSDIGLDLVQGDPMWRLARSGAPGR